jgi:hypothetical protein
VGTSRHHLAIHLVAETCNQSTQVLEHLLEMPDLAIFSQRRHRLQSPDGIQRVPAGLHLTDQRSQQRRFLFQKFSRIHFILLKPNFLDAPSSYTIPQWYCTPSEMTSDNSNNIRQNKYSNELFKQRLASSTGTSDPSFGGLARSLSPRPQPTHPRSTGPPAPPNHTRPQRETQHPSSSRGDPRSTATATAVPNDRSKIDAQPPRPPHESSRAGPTRRRNVDGESLPALREKSIHRECQHGHEHEGKKSPPKSRKKFRRHEQPGPHHPGQLEKNYRKTTARQHDVTATTSEKAAG